MGVNVQERKEKKREREREDPVPPPDGSSSKHQLKEETGTWECEPGATGENTEETMDTTLWQVTYCICEGLGMKRSFTPSKYSEWMYIVDIFINISSKISESSLVHKLKSVVVVKIWQFAHH